jgi:hypothetical protein
VLAICEGIERIIGIETRRRSQSSSRERYEQVRYKDSDHRRYRTRSQGADLGPAGGGFGPRAPGRSPKFLLRIDFFAAKNSSLKHISV